MTRRYFCRLFVNYLFIRRKLVLKSFAENTHAVKLRYESDSGKIFIDFDPGKFVIAQCRLEIGSPYSLPFGIIRLAVTGAIGLARHYGVVSSLPHSAENALLLSALRLRQVVKRQKPSYYHWNRLKLYDVYTALLSFYRQVTNDARFISPKVFWNIYFLFPSTWAAIVKTVHFYLYFILSSLLVYKITIYTYVNFCAD